MLEIKGENIIVTRGNYMPLVISTKNPVDGTDYIFQIDDVIRFKVFEKGKVDNVILEKDFKVNAPSIEIDINIDAEEMKIGELINKPKDYWYEIELNPDTPITQTIIGYDKDKGAAILTLLPEGGDNDDKG